MMVFPDGLVAPFRLQPFGSDKRAAGAEPLAPGGDAHVLRRRARPVSGSAFGPMPRPASGSASGLCSAAQAGEGC